MRSNENNDKDGDKLFIDDNEFIYGRALAGIERYGTFEISTFTGEDSLVKETESNNDEL